MSEIIHAYALHPGEVLCGEKGWVWKHSVRNKVTCPKCLELMKQFSTSTVANSSKK